MLPENIFVFCRKKYTIMKIILSDKEISKQFWPLALTRSVADFRIGALTIREKYEIYLKENVAILTADHVQNKYGKLPEEDSIIVDASIIPDKNLLEAVINLDKGFLIKDELVIAAAATKTELADFNLNNPKGQAIEYNGEIKKLEDLSSVFTYNPEEIVSDYKLLTDNRNSQPISKTNILIGNGEVFAEKDCFIEACSLNTNDGPIYIGKNAQIMEGSHIRGPAIICDNAVVKMGAKIYGGTTIGPGCKVGGEINNSVFFANSNKAHDGYLGNSVIGEWCNLGADTNNSNLKNNYKNVKIWSYQKEGFIDTGLQFCGLIMGDHSKCGINTMFNTGTVIGVSVNIFGSGFPRNFVPSFSWGGHSGFKEYNIKDAIEVANLVLKRRNLSLSTEEIEILSFIFEYSKKFRK